MFNHGVSQAGAWSVPTEVATGAGNVTPEIVHESSHDKEKEQRLLLCVVLNFGLANSFVVHCKNKIAGP